MLTGPLSSPTTAVLRALIVAIAPALALVGHAYHPWIGSPGDAEFLRRLAAAVTADPTRWGVSHLLVGVGSGLLAVAFLAIRSYLREHGEDRYSALGIPFIVMGSTLYALLPAMEFAAFAAARTGADVAAAQSAILPWFVPILWSAATLFALGVLGFALGIARSGVLSRRLTWLVVCALVVLGATRFMPVGVAQLYVGPAVAVVALWPLAIAMWRQRRAPEAQSVDIARAPLAGAEPARTKPSATRRSPAGEAQTKRHRSRR